MVKCCVPCCENDSNYPINGISFHRFPPEMWQQHSWFHAICCNPQTAMICSEHFDHTDFLEICDGSLHLKTDAVPKIHICRICLQTDMKMLDMDKYNLSDMYETIVGVQIHKESSFKNMLCVECVQMLLKCHKFREKSVLAHSTLMDLLVNNKQISKEIMSIFLKERGRLKSQLTFKHFEPNYYDFNFNHEDLLTTKLDSTNENIDVKYEEKTGLQPDVKLEEDELYIADDLDRLADNTDFSNNDTAYNYSSDDDLTLKEIEQQKRMEKDEKKIDRRKKKKRINTKNAKKRLHADDAPKIDKRRKPLSDGLCENLFTIIKLSTEEQKEEILKRQESLNFKNSPLKCMDCYKGFLDEKAYSTHMIKHSDKFGPYACNICNTHFKVKSKVTKHRTAIHCYEYRCNQCAFITTNRQSAKLHEGWHKGKMYKCSHCSDVFIKFTTYMGHLRIKHPSDFVCELCGYAFVSAKGIKLHKKLKHVTGEKVPEDGPFCESCNIRFLSEEALARHLTVSARHKHESHPSQVQFPNRPPQSFKTNRVKNAIQDSRLMTAQDLTCEQCGMQMNDARAYHLHFRKMHPDKNRTMYPSMKTPCMCDKCGKFFQSYALLKDHLHIHSTERRFKCPTCDKTFRMKQRLTTHMATHKQQRYPCHVCGKSFSNVGNRQRHMIIHTGLRPHKCEMCSKTFKTSTEKKTHINYVHLKKPWPKRNRGRRTSKQGQNMQVQGASETELQTWPPCEKLGLANVINEKPVYYDLKI